MKSGRARPGKLEDILMECLRLAPSVNDATAMTTVTNKAGELLALMKTLADGSQALLPKAAALGSANKLAEKQIRLVCFSCYFCELL